MISTVPIRQDTPDERVARWHTLAETAARAHTQMHAENFPVALRLLPRAPRDRLLRLYAFARFVDDVGDETPGGPDPRLQLLDDVAADLEALPGGGARLGPVRGLRPLTDHGVPLQPFRDLLEANRVDQRVTRYETFDDLLGYCRLSAAPVGAVVLHVAGTATAENLADSDAVCAALQVLEHCQDVAEDHAAGRVYLPRRDLVAAGIGDGAGTITAELDAATSSAALRSVVAVQVDRAEQLLTRGRGLIARQRGWARVAVAGYVAGGLATVDALRAVDHDVLYAPVRPTKAGTARHALRLLAARS